MMMSTLTDSLNSGLDNFHHDYSSAWMAGHRQTLPQIARWPHDSSSLLKVKLYKFLVLGIKPRALHMLSKRSAMKLCSQPSEYFGLVKIVSSCVQELAKFLDVIKAFFLMSKWNMTSFQWAQPCLPQSQLQALFMSKLQVFHIHLLCFLLSVLTLNLAKSGCSDDESLNDELTGFPCLTSLLPINSA